MKKIFLLAAVAAFLASSCKKGSVIIPDTCRLTKISDKDYYDQSFEYNTPGKLISKTSVSAFESTFEYELFRKQNDQLDYAKVYAEGAENGMVKFTYSGENLTKVEESDEGGVYTVHLFTYYPNGLVKTCEHQYLYDPSYNNLIRLDYNGDGVLTKMSRFSNGKLYRYEAYKLKGTSSPAAELSVMNYGLPQIQFLFFEPNTVRDPGVGTIVEGFNVDENGNAIKDYEAVLKSKRLNRSGFTSYLYWEGTDGEPVKTTDYTYECRGVKP